jgi:Zn finger protein HypA/HybF involved in hydrogenase expression
VDSLGEELIKQLASRLEALEKKLEALEKGGGGAKEHRHVLSINGNKARCKDCDLEVELDDRYAKISSFDDVLELLKIRHGEHNYRFLECHNCRPKFIKLLRDMGFNVKERGREIVIRM